MNASAIASHGLAPSAPTAPKIASPPSGVPSSPQAATSASSAAANRDSAVLSLLDITSRVNSLKQAANAAQTGDSALIPLPALQLGPLPTPKPVAAPADNHGKSDIVFSEPDDDTAPIR